MKRIFLLILIIVTVCRGQNVVQEINITPGSTSINTSLPFDKPIILKWTSKYPVTIEYAGLIEVKRGDVSNYYDNYASQNSFFIYSRNINNDDIDITQTRLTDDLELLADGNYQLNIFIPPLKPNKFYDIKILRKPIEPELELYFDLFTYIVDNVQFNRRLQVINRIKKPFSHEGPTGVARLRTFYDVHLKTLYGQYAAAAAADKPAIKEKIKAQFLLQWPPSLPEQSDDYLNLFKAIELNSANIALCVRALALKQEGFVPMTSGGAHIGTMDIVALKALYLGDGALTTLVKKYVSKEEALATAQTEDEKKQLKTEIAQISSEFEDYVLHSTLPKATVLFIFGQTLSSTTKSFTFDTRASYTITPDFGYVFYGFESNFDNFVPYLGFQLEFRYFDKNIPFNLIRPKSILHYLSFTTGLTLAPMKKEGKRDDFFNGKSLVLGLGLRMSSATRLTFGGILFRKEDTNPLIDDKRLAITPYIGLSIDLKLKSLLNDFYGLTSAKKP